MDEVDRKAAGITNRFLECSIQSFFQRDRYLKKVVDQLHQRGYSTVGDLANAKSETTIFAGIRTTARNKQRFKDALQEGFVYLGP